MLRHVATEPAELNEKLSAVSSKQQHKHRSLVHASDSDFKVNDDGSLQEPQLSRPLNRQTSGVSSPSLSTSQSSSKHRKQHKADWEILEGLREGQRCEEVPRKKEGYLLKRRKWPMKGWHKRYFVLENGILLYSKTSSDVAKGKLLGEVNVGLSVISTKSQGRRIDIDAEEAIYHLKVKRKESFEDWVAHLKHHRLYRQHKIAFGHTSSKVLSPVDDVVPRPSPADGSVSTWDGIHSSRTPGVSSRSRVATWLADSNFFDDYNKDLANAQQAIVRLKSLLEPYDVVSRSTNAVNAESSVSFTIQGMGPLSTSNPNLSSSQNAGLVPDVMDSSLLQPSLPLAQKSYERGLQDSFLVTANHALQALQNVARMAAIERDHFKQLLEVESVDSPYNSGASLSALHSSLIQALHQNAELRSRLSKIHVESEMNECPTSPDSIPGANHPSFSHESSSVVSISEYYDATEYLREQESSSEVSVSDEDDDDGSFTSDNSEAETEGTPAPSSELSESQGHIPFSTGRRTRLPVPKPDVGNVNLWSLLCRNIGKDLSKISMPVTLNEPLNTLQRLCEELEYSELLDKASETDNPYERMVLMAAFAVSAYSSSSCRAAHKPFNPLLGETYECIREDKGFRFIAEQVSHHPPVSACHAESKNFVFWQDMRVKTTFWGKSMEVQPIGTVHVVLVKHDEHYCWNKITSCIHNVLGGQRWVDLYGELCISCGDVRCKLTFAKAPQGSNKQYEITGSVSGKDGKPTHCLFGKWNEALYCGVSPSARCIWRIGALPEDSELYYGFTRFAIELNELEQEMAKYLPPTDSRFRPDQRLLEEGNIAAAETVKVQLEQLQRDRKKKWEERREIYEPSWFRKTSTDDDKDSWEFTGRYWILRKNPGFINVNFLPRLW